ncbi:hypothetical protein SMB34_00585 [Thalassospira permensis NBRC 106175]|uniref:Uncharacterized protein n=1 Tax=Thalassospira permensis NBRC 106175 TaxID=1353532 RepID=A0ABR4TTS4_9PROT|nr:hypothetical protein SMB34_00585 [Thalassospira permensis NBRC 106175]
MTSEELFKSSYFRPIYNDTHFGISQIGLLQLFKRPHHYHVMSGLIRRAAIWSASFD